MKRPVYVKFVRYNLKDSHHCHVCNCQLSTSYKEHTYCASITVIKWRLSKWAR